MSSNGYRSSNRRNPPSENMEVCGVKALSFLLLVFNVFLLFSAVAIVLLTIWIAYFRFTYFGLFGSAGWAINAVIHLLLVAGILGIVTAIIGFITYKCVSFDDEDAGYKEKKQRLTKGRCILLCYFFLMFIIFFAELIAGGAAFIISSDLKHDGNKNPLIRSLNDTIITKYGVDADSSVEQGIDELQLELGCCGARNFLDWKHSEWLVLVSNETGSEIGENENRVPDSCCLSSKENCGNGKLHWHPSNIFYEGCAVKISRLFRDKLILIAAVGLGICFIQIVGLLLSGCILCRTRS